MKIVTVVCSDCGHEKKEKHYSEDEAKRQNARIVRPHCEKCKSLNVRVYQ